MRKGEGDATSGVDLLSGAPEGTRVPGTIAHRLFNARRIHLQGPDFATLFFFFHFFHFSLFSSPSSSFVLSFYLEAREARTTCLLEKSARLPRALINLHSVHGEQKGEGGNSSRVTTRVTRINVANRMRSC